MLNLQSTKYEEVTTNGLFVVIMHNGMVAAKNSNW